MTPAFTVAELLAHGASKAEQQVSVSGWVWDLFEHCAIYDQLPAVATPDPKGGIWLSGQLPERRTTRGDGPLHRKLVRLTGKFHWQPKRGAGHFGRWPAWLGVVAVEHIDTTTAESPKT
jgi:hypothetical protein